MWSYIFFSCSLIAALIFVLITLAAFVSKKFQFYPPPKKQGWQHPTFMILFRAFVYPLVILTVLQFQWQKHEYTAYVYAAGGLLLIVGFGLASFITFKMGWRNAFGEKRGLKTTGWFSWSRNPIYVVTWFGLLGWGLIANSTLVSILLLIWAVSYILAPFLEEPWLEEMYGEEYLAYKEKVRRFI